MAKIVTLGTLVTRCTKRADGEGDGHVTPDFKEYIHELYGEMHGHVTEAGARYWESEQTINANGADTYALPADHLQTIGVDFVVDAAGRRTPLDDMMVTERTDFYGQVGQAQVFALIGTNLALYPKPSGGTYKHVYVPQPVDLSAAIDATNVDLINVWGEKFVIWGVASIALHKGSENQVRAIGERDKALEQVLVWANQRAAQYSPKRKLWRSERIGNGPGDEGDWNYGR